MMGQHLNYFFPSMKCEMSGESRNYSLFFYSQGKITESWKEH